MTKGYLKITSLILGFMGAIMLSAIILPLVSYELKSTLANELITPISSNYLESVKKGENDLTKASNWFEGIETKSETISKVEYFSLSVPALNIENAIVTIGGEDLEESLIQYPGTALPGEIGNSVIFGHSVLPIFFNPKNYLTIFSTLPKLDEGDMIYANYDGVKYRYKVVDKFEVLPTDIQILDQESNGSFLSLVTCTPPGDPRKPKRLVVRAQIVPYTQANADTLN